MEFAQINLSPITLVIFTLIFFSGVTLCLVYQTRNAEIFSRVLLFSTAFLFIHSVCIGIISAFFSRDPWRDLLAPFGLMYGPILYFNISVVRVRIIRYWQVTLHGIPFLLFLVFYISLLLTIIPNEMHIISTGKTYLEYACTISFIGYSIWTFTVEKHIIYNRLKQKVLLLVLGQLLLVFVSVFSIILFFTHSMARSTEAILFARLLIYTCMFLCILVIFNYAYNKKLQASALLKVKNNQDKTPPKPKSTKYERSSLSIIDLEQYENKLRAIMEQDKLYLQKTLSLTTLAHLLKIPNHHLTQVFSQRMHVTFYQYINGLRIRHACMLIKQQEPTIPVADLAYMSGFNSVVSFNRQFKLIMKCTPSEYVRAH